MVPNTSGWWTDEKVHATVTSQYVHSHLRPNEAEQLTKSVFGDLSDDTYLEWILTRSKRFFLTLVEAGVPDQIFGIIDDSWDDEDLPIPEDEVPDLLLSAEPDRTLDRHFYRAQFKYLIRIIGDGEHIRYAQEETIPVNPLASKSVMGKTKDGIEKVKLPSSSRRVFARKRIVLTNRRMEEELLAEMADWRSFAHDHVLSIFGSYTTGDNLFVLMTPAPEYTLKSFLTDSPKAFDLIPKPERRRIALQWSHCLAKGLAWLHHNGKHHGAIRPSRIYIDQRFQISFGLFDGTRILCDSTVKDDIEAYQYAAPERWKRSVTIQTTGNSTTALPSGGRTGRRLTMEAERSMSEHSSVGSGKLNTVRPTSVSYVFSPISKTGSRLRLGSAKRGITRVATAASRKVESRQTTHVTDGMRPVRTSLETHLRPGASSVLSSNSNESARPYRQGGPIYAASPEMRTAVVQTWASAQHDQLAADIFSLGAIIMDILTFLCKHSFNSFARHRSTKNKSAGRGGGLADASFHANIGQVFSWAQMLQTDAEKKLKKDDGVIFKAIGPCLQVVLQCLEREPTDRLGASDLQKKLCEHIRDFAGLESPQCCLDCEMHQSEESPQSRATSMDMLRQMTASRQQVHQDNSKAKRTPEMQYTEKIGVSTLTPRLESLKLSPSNLNGFQFDVSNSTTLINSEQQTNTNAQVRPDSFAFATGDSVEVFPRPPTASSKRRQPRSEISNEQINATPPTSGISHPHIPSANAAPSVAASTTGAATEDFQSVYSYTPPPSAHPTRELPPVPRSSSLRTAPSPNQFPIRSTSRQVLTHPPSDDSKTTALPALPGIEKYSIDINNMHSSTSASRAGNRRPSSRMDDADDISPVEPNQRHYRAPSRTGMNENRMYASRVGRDRLALRGLQYP